MDIEGDEKDLLLNWLDRGLMDNVEQVIKPYIEKHLKNFSDFLLKTKIKLFQLGVEFHFMLGLRIYPWPWPDHSMEMYFTVIRELAKRNFRVQHTSSLELVVIAINS